MPTTRKLAAIMFTDIKDFTKRMNASESRGMRLLQKHNEIMDGAIERHQGELVKNIGDAPAAGRLRLRRHVHRPCRAGIVCRSLRTGRRRRRREPR